MDNIRLKIADDLSDLSAAAEGINPAEKCFDLPRPRAIDFAAAAKIRVNIMSIFMEQFSNARDHHLLAAESAIFIVNQTDSHILVFFLFFCVHRRKHSQ